MKRQREIKRVISEIGRLVSELQRGQTCSVGGPSDFELEIHNGFDNITPMVKVWTWNAGTFESQAQTIEEGFRDVLAQMHHKLGRCLRHECSICHKIHDGYDLSVVPVEAFKELMQEIIEIAAAMNSEKTEPKIARNQGPIVNLQINTINRFAQLYFADIQNRFGEGKYLENVKFFKSEKGLCSLQSIEDVLTQAHKHLKKHGRHSCPICGKKH